MSKKFRMIVLLIAASVLLTACGGAFGASSWPGITYDADNNLVYVAYGQGVFALQAENGVSAWTYPSEGSNGFTVYAAPTLDESGNLIVGDYSKGLSSINPANNGTLNWSYSDAGDRYIGSSIAIDGSIFVPNADGLLYAFSESGALRWTFDSGEAIWSTPVSDGENIYVASMNHTLSALNPRNGNVNWELDLEGAVVGDLAMDENGTIYVGTFNQEVLAISSASGRIQWRQPTEGWVWGGSAYSDNVVYAGDLEGNLYAFDAQSGSELWHIAAGGAITGHPLIANEHIYVGTENGQVLSVDLEGRIQWTQTFTGEAYSSPVLAGDLIVIGLVEGDSTAIALDTNGNTVWSFNAEN